MSESQATKAGDARGKGAVGRLLAFAGPRKALTYLGCALSAVSMLVSFGPYVCVWLVARDLIAVAPDWGAATGIAAYGWWAFGLAAASILLYFAGLMCTHLAAFRCASNMRKRTTDQLMHASLGYFDTHASGALRRVVDGCAAETEGILAHKLPDTAGSIAMIVGMLVLFFVFDWRLALASLWSCPVGLAILFGARRALQPMMETTRMRGLATSEDIQEALECVREVRATNQEERYLEHIHADVDAAERQAARSEIACGIAVNGAQIVLRLGLATTVLVGASLILEGSCTFMTLFAFLLVVSRIYAPFDQCLMLIAELFSAKTAAARMKGFYEEPLAQGGEKYEPAGHDVSFENVSFSYDGIEKVLDGVTFTAREGEVTALVGPSGSGKSTCARLAARLWDADAGRVTVDGVDVAGVDPEVLLADFSVVFQDVLLFDDTVMGNIRLGRRGATDEEVLAAARAANCDEFVSRLPQGYDTMIGENGTRLSGGERQRISIARALLKGAPVVLLDEATASLDVENETEVQGALSRLLAGKTVIVIAHRMRTVMSADKVVVLEDGRVAEQGSPEGLLATDGLFARMVRLQTESANWAL